MMTPRLIALFLSEDVSENNGLIFEVSELVKYWDRGLEIHGKDFEKSVPVGEIDLAGYPKVGPDVALPTFAIPKDLHLDVLYKLLIDIATKTGNQLKVKCKQGMLKDRETLPYDVRRATEFNEYPAVIYAVWDGKKMIGLSTLIHFAKERRLSAKQNRFNPEEWAQAVEANIASVDIADRLPAIFANYYGVENPTAEHSLLTSGKMGEGLYLIPFELEIDGKVMNWVEAAEIFSANPSAYLKAAPPETKADRIRLLFRDWLQATGQGRYIARTYLDPYATVELFGDVGSVDEFVNSYETKREDIERLERLLSD
jgi:hypothetical protein